MAPTLPLFALTVLSLAAPSAQFTTYEDGSCRLIGDPDVYGVGVRISYYLAFFSGVIALAACNHRAVEDVKKGTTIIGFAILIVLIRNAVQGSLAVFEWDLVFTMVFLLMSIAFIPLTIMGSRNSSAALCLVYGLYAVLLPWIFFTLADQGRREDCELKAFLFAYFDFYNIHWVAFLKALSVFSCLTGIIFIVAGFALLVYRLTADDGDDKADIDDDMRSGFVALAIVALVIGVITIVFTEKLISGNDVDLSDDSLGSTNQLIPFLVGLFTLMSTIWTVFDDIRKGE